MALQREVMIWVRIQASKSRSRLPLLFLSLALLAGLLAAFVPSASPVRNELILVQDVSGSVRRVQGTALPPFVEPLLQQAEIRFVVQVARRAAVGVWPMPDGAFAQDDGGASDLAAGLERALALPRPGRTRRRIVLLSDGRETRGSADQIARQAVDRALIEAVAIGGIPAPDVRALDLRVPSAVRAQEHFAVTLAATSATPTQARAVVRDREGRILAEQALVVTPAGATCPLNISLASSGVQLLEARLIAEGDVVPENDAVRACVLVRREARVLWLGEAPPSAMLAPNLDMDVQPPAALTAARLAQAACVVLDNVAQDSLPPGSGRLLLQAVQDGTGLLILGGPQSLGPGGYDREAAGDVALSALLPVRLEPMNSLALVLALDISGSMGDEIAATGGRTDKISLAVKGIREAWQKLAVGDHAGLVTFAERAETPLPMIRIAGESNRESLVALNEALRLRTGGSTRMFRALETALAMLEPVRARRRHILVVADGQSDERGPDLEAAVTRLATAMHEQQISLTVVTVGSDPDEALLEVLAKRAGATILKASDRLLILPAILAEAVRQGRAYEETRVPVAALQAHPITRGLAADALPVLARMIAVGPAHEDKGAVALLQSPEGDPLAAAWQLGLGRVVVMTGRPWQEWAWPADATTGRWLQQAYAWCLANAVERGVVQAVHEDATVRIAFVEPARGLPPETRAGLCAQVTPFERSASGVTAESLPADLPGPLPLYPVAAQLWEGRGPAPAPGLYRVDVRVQGESAVWLSAPLLVEGGQEWRALGVDGTALARIALAGGGDLVAGYEQFAPWDRIPVHGGREEPAISPTLLVAAIVFLLLGLAASAWR